MGWTYNGWLAMLQRTQGGTTMSKYRLLDDLTSAERKEYPITSGVIDYFPDALAYVAYVSWLGNQKHNPGQPMHHARGKSTDHADCIARHLSQRGEVEEIVVNGVTHEMRHTGELAWRALALLQQELEEELSLSTPRGAKEDYIVKDLETLIVERNNG